MRKTLLLLLVFLTTKATNAQTEKFTIDIKIKSLSYKEESVEFDKPHLVTATTIGCTDIFTIGKTKSYEYGIKLEILRSNFYTLNSYVVAKAFYIKSGNDWEEISKFNHTNCDAKSIAERSPKEYDKDNYNGYSVGDPKFFEVKVNDYYYYSK